MAIKAWQLGRRNIENLKIQAQPVSDSEIGTSERASNEGLAGPGYDAAIHSENSEFWAEAEQAVAAADDQDEAQPQD